MKANLKLRLGVLALLLCLTGGACADRTAEPEIAIPPRRLTPVVQCTPPPCWDDETYYCGGECPGGCGTICATRTPDPKASPTPTFPALSRGCTLPTPGPDASGPALYVCASATTIRIGETVRLSAEVTEATDPEFAVWGQDLEGTGSFSVRAKATNRTRDWYSYSTILDLVSVQVSDSRLYVELKALAPGAVEIEIGAGPPYPALHAAPLTIAVEP
jgi:hypothetical protein